MLYYFDIIGSCVTRDAFELTDNFHVKNYISRQSLISATSRPLNARTMSSIVFSKDTKPFIKRTISNDLNKLYFNLFDTRTPIIIDLIDERFNVFLTKCDTYVTYSAYAAKYSNILSIRKKTLFPFNKDRLNIFYSSVKKLHHILCNYKIVVHWALYDNYKIIDNNAIIPIEHFRANFYLEKMYNILLNTFTKCNIIKVPDNLTHSSPIHKWGYEPFHYTDDYYIYFLKSLSQIFDYDIIINNNTLQI